MSKILYLMVLWCAGAVASTIGLEDLRGPQPFSDRDFNDVELVASGLHFNLTGAYVFTPLPGYSEVPLPNGNYFDYATVDGPTGVAFLSAQSAYMDTAMVRVGAGAWLDVPVGGLSIMAPVGTVVLFGVRTPYATFYSEPGMNSDGLYHAAVSDDAPEPGYGVAGGLLLAAYAGLRRVRTSSEMPRSRACAEGRR